MPKFVIEQLALYPADPAAAIELLTEMGAGEWARDHVVANGQVFGEVGQNEADLAFAYEMGTPKPLELEVLNYTEGQNWMEDNRTNISPHRVSHIGMHCSAAELEEWREFFNNRGIAVAQEVLTESHTNPHIAGKRWYNYVIFDTLPILGVDVKFIVRHDQQPRGEIS